MHDELYVIFEWNQAGGGPRLYTGHSDEPYETEAEALADAAAATAAAAPRLDRYTVHAVNADAIARRRADTRG